MAPGWIKCARPGQAIPWGLIVAQALLLEFPPVDVIANMPKLPVSACSVRPGPVGLPAGKVLLQ